MGYCMVIDLKKCVGCHACSVVCKSENGTSPGVMRAKVMKKETGTYPHTKRTSLPMLCMHCEDAACVKVCPTGATEKQDDGIVTVDKEKCIGCRACIMACPYSARYFIESTDGYFGAELTPYEQARYSGDKGVVDKCDFCRDRVKDGKDPACVQACVTGARTFGTFEELEDLIASRNGYQLRKELGTNPSVYYLP